MFYSVDRIEGPLAVLQDDEGENRAVPLAELPEGLREGDVLCREGGAGAPPRRSGTAAAPNCRRCWTG